MCCLSQQKRSALPLPSGWGYEIFERPSKKICVCLCVGTRWVQNASKLKLCLPRQKWTMTETLTFSKISPSTFNTLIPASFLLVSASLKFLLVFLQMSYMSSNLEMNLQFRKREKKLYEARCGEYSGCCSCIILSFIKKKLSKTLNCIVNMYVPLTYGTHV